MCGDEDGRALGGKLVDEVPELAPGNRVHPAGGLIQEQQRRAMQHGTTQGETLTPATRKAAHHCTGAPFQSSDVQNFLDTGFFSCPGNFVDPGVELQIFQHGQLIVEREFL